MSFLSFLLRKKEAKPSIDEKLRRELEELHASIKRNPSKVNRLNRKLLNIEIRFNRGIGNKTVKDKDNINARIQAIRAQISEIKKLKPKKK